MNREILFRGQRVDTKEWVYGHLSDEDHILENGFTCEIQAPEYHTEGMGCGIEDRNITDRYDAMHYGFQEALEMYAQELPDFFKVIPQTVGQFTGVLDRNKNKIFEGDIIKISNDYDTSESKHEVKYFADDNYPAFDIHPGIDVDSNCLSHLTMSDDEGIEIIGNIHDNPERLNN
jgi:hypothetical protein